MPPVFVQIIYVLLCVVLLGACDDNSQTQVNPGAKHDFIIPENGKLGEEQVLDYIAIQEKIKQRIKQREQQELKNLISKSPEVERNFPYFDEIEKSAALETGLSYAEYIWVKDTIIKTRTAIWLKHYYEVNNKIVALLDKTLDRYNETSTTELDKLERQKMNGYVKEMKKELSSVQNKLNDTDHQPDAGKHNSELVAKYLSQLEVFD